MSDIVRGAALPSKAGPPVYDVIAPAIGELYDVTLLDEYVLGVDCHWVIDPTTKKGRSRICWRYQGDCPHCGKDRNLWLGWIGCLDMTRKVRKILRMGADSAKALATALPKGHTPRGKRYDVSRAKSAATSVLLFNLSQSDPPAHIPIPHDMTATLCLVLGCEYIPDYRFSLEEVRARDVP